MPSDRPNDQASRERPTREPVSPLVFVHVPKAAGTSLKELIARVYRGRPTLLFAPGDGRLERFATMPPQSRAACAVVGGHEPFGLQRVYDGTGLVPAVITALREPVARVVSLYRYIFAEPDHARHASFVASRPTVRDVLGARDFRPFDNHQVRYLAGREVLDKPVGAVDRDDLETAKRNLSEGCAAFALQHRMDESLGLFRERLGWPDATLPRLNTARPRVNAPDVTDEHRATIAAANGLDTELFDFAERLFDQMLGEERLARVSGA